MIYNFWSYFSIFDLQSGKIRKADIYGNLVTRCIFTIYGAWRERDHNIANKRIDFVCYYML